MTAPRPKLDIDVTREKLTALGCGYAAAALEPLRAEAVRRELTAHLFLERLLDAERAGREERRIRTMLKSSKIPTGQTLENVTIRGDSYRLREKRRSGLLQKAAAAPTPSPA